jgi:hypothetical protein
MVGSSSSPSPQEHTEHTRTETVETRQSEEEEYIVPLPSDRICLHSGKRMTVTTLIVNDGGALEATEVQLKTTFQNNNVSPPVSPFKGKSSRRQEYPVSPKPDMGSCQRRGRFLIWPAVPTATTGRLWETHSNLELRLGLLPIFRRQQQLLKAPFPFHKRHSPPTATRSLHRSHINRTPTDSTPTVICTLSTHTSWIAFYTEEEIFTLSYIIIESHNRWFHNSRCVHPIEVQIRCRAVMMVPDSSWALRTRRVKRSIFETQSCFESQVLLAPNAAAFAFAIIRPGRVRTWLFRIMVVVD